jgi:hypothetical protein
MLQDFTIPGANWAKGRDTFVKKVVFLGESSQSTGRVSIMEAAHQILSLPLFCEYPHANHRS